MDKLKNGWFSEFEFGHCFSLECNEILYKSKSKYQDILVFNNKKFGNVLILDDHIQCTDLDECSYHEMIAFLPLNCHRNPENVLIIGGGDGGLVRECSKHPLVKHITLCEIDQEVLQVSKTYFPKLAQGFESNKLEIFIGDGFEFLKTHTNEFDVIITDSSDPEGPALNLFEESYYELLLKALKPNDGINYGIICCQGENFWNFKDLISKIISFAGDVFPSVSYAQTQIPSYIPGCIGFILASLEKNKKFSTPIHIFDKETVENLNLNYYNSELHKAAFVMPNLFQNVLDQSSSNYTK